jgi:hypothetical protein
VSQVAPRDAVASTDCDAEDVSEGFRCPGECETHGSFAGLRVREYGLGSGQHLFPGVELGRLHVVGEQGLPSGVVQGSNRNCRSPCVVLEMLLGMLMPAPPLRG